MNLFRKDVVFAAGLLCTLLPAVAGRGEPVMILNLKDGSHLTAVIESRFIPLATDYGKLKIPSAMVGGLTIDGESTEAQVKVVNGDNLSGMLTASALRIRNALGGLSVPWGEVAELRTGPEPPSPEQLTGRPATRSPIRFEVFLRDGSCLLGGPEEGEAGFLSVLGRTALPWSLVRGVTFHDDLETSTVRFWNGDSIVGCIDWKTCAIATSVGPVHLSSVSTSRIEVSLGGIDLVAKPYAEVSGNRYFMGAVQSSRPKVINGRLRPPTQFIEAHASGRIEYEFDEPITEFRAIATMYSSYCAHKGRVIFRVETEHGPVHATRSLRNLEREEVYARFSPAKRIILVTDECGSSQEDWSVWLWPEVR